MRRINKPLLALLGLFFLAFSVTTSAQGEADTLLNGCSGNFDFPLDPGDYTAGLDTSWTYCPDSSGTEGNSVSFNFLIDNFGLDAGDSLYVYDGPNMDADILMVLGGAGPPDGADFGVQPSPGNLSGCITFQLVTDADTATTSGGWVSLVSCQWFCQPIIPVVTTEPAVTPADTGYIDICQGATVNFSATAEYPLQGGWYYPQSDETSTFRWAFGDGSTAEGQEVSNTYFLEGGYLVYLTVSNLIMDGADTVLYCENTELAVFKVRVSTTPIFNGTMVLDDPLCIDVGTTMQGTAAPQMAALGASGLTAGTTFLPDGSGVSYQTDVVITAFAPGQTLDDINDLLGICLNMEHSYLGDLAISITCPDGTTVTMKSYPGGGNTFLGEPIDDDANLDPGVGYDYCWSPDPEYLDMTTESANYTTLPEGSYTSEEALDALVGCPLNGTWTITVQDNLGSDNGYIFYWGLSLDPSISPFYEEFTPEIVDMWWSDHPTITSVINDSTVTIIGTEETPVEYTFNVTDNFGCSYDTTIILDVYPRPSLIPQDSACADAAVEVLVENTFEGGYWSVIFQENDTATVTISDSTSLNPEIFSDAEGVVRLSFSDEYCSTVDSLELYFNPKPTVDVISGDLVCWGDTLYLSAVTTGPVDSYLWNTEEYDPNPTGATSFIIGDKTKVYGVTIDGFCGSAEDGNFIESRPCFVVCPNIITPNADGENDIFEVEWIEYFPNSRLVIHNRWGLQVFESDNYSNDIDVAWNADGLNDGVYFYTLILNDAHPRAQAQDKIVKGSVTVTREKIR